MVTTEAIEVVATLVTKAASTAWALAEAPSRRTNAAISPPIAYFSLLMFVNLFFSPTTIGEHFAPDSVEPAHGGPHDNGGEKCNCENFITHDNDFAADTTKNIISFKSNANRKICAEILNISCANISTPLSVMDLLF